MHPIYSLDSTINSFFESLSTVTRRQCDDLAISLFGEPINPAPIQGAFSYTLIAGVKQSMIIQFRAQSSVLDMETSSLARAIYGQIVAACTYHGDIGQPSPISIYVIEKLPGITCVQARYMNGLLEKASQQSNIVVGFARFFAASWKHRQTKPSNIIENIYHEYKQKFDLLCQTLPSRFMENLKRVLVELPLLFTPTYPSVLTHNDLCEMNIFVDPNTGHITGIIDWAEARILPFGISSRGLENTLGYMDSQGWHYYNNHHRLKGLFWQIFKEIVGGVSEADRQAIRVARMAGFFLRYGFVWEDRVREIPAKEPDSALRYLDAFCTSDDGTAI